MKAGPKGQADLSPLPWNPRSRGADQFRLFCEKFLKVPKGLGARKPFLLRDWQRDLVNTLYEGDTQTAVWVIPRGNGKSALAAALALHHLFMFGEGARVAVVAQDERSATRLLETAARMIHLNDDLAARAVVYKDKIKVPGTDSVFLALPAEASRVEGEDLTLAILDEIGYMPRATFEAAVLSTGKRDGSKTLCIGTPSTPAWQEKSPLWDLVLKGRSDEEDKSFRLVEFGADPSLPIDATETWAVANPAFEAHEGGWLTEKALRSQFGLTSENEFRRARLGQWVTQSQEAAFQADKWNTCERKGVTIPHGSKVVLALDGSKNGDSTAILIGSVSKKPHYQPGGVWDPNDHEEGWEVPILEVEDRIRALCNTYQVVEVAADPYLWQRTIQVLSEEGIPMYAFPQSPQRITPATIDLRGAIHGELMTHSGDPTFTRHVLAANLEETTRGVKLVKPKRRTHIDLAAALVMCHSRCSWLATSKQRKKVKGFTL